MSPQHSGSAARAVSPIFRSRKTFQSLSRFSAVAVLALAAACGGGDGGSGPQPNPVPAIAELTPAVGIRGSAETTVTVTGSGFVRESVVRLDGGARPTEYVSATILRARFSAGDLAQARFAQVTVANPAPGGGASNAAEFGVVSPNPEITAVSPATAEAGRLPLTLTLTGSGFLPETQARIRGEPRQVTYVSPTELRITATGADVTVAGTVSLDLQNPQPGGGVAIATFNVVNPTPAIASLNPASVLTGSVNAVVAVVGTGFAAQSRVFVNGEQRQPTSLSNTEIRIAMMPADVWASGTLQIRVENPAPGGGASNAATLEVRAPVPVITGFVDGSTEAGGTGFALFVNGSGFAANSVVRVDGAARTTRFATPTQLEATLTAADLQLPGGRQITVFTPAPGGGTSNAATFMVGSPAPEISSISPTSVPTGSPGATVTVRGAGFVPQSQVLAMFRGSGGTPTARPTTYVSAGELRVALPAADLAAAGELELHVRNPAPGGGSAYTVLSLDAPRPAITSLSPAFTMDGQQSFTLRINGTGFVSNTVGQFDLTDRPTRYIGPTQIEITLGANDLRNAGVYPITASNPGPAGGVSEMVNFEVRAPVPTITSLGATQTTAGQSSHIVRVNGTGFRVLSELRVNGEQRPGSRLGATQMEVILLESDLRTPGTLQITVFTPGPGGGTSNAATFQVVASAP